MRILIFGATGRTGRELVSQALRRGQNVSSFVRSPGKLTVVDTRLRVVQGDIQRAESIHAAVPEHDAVLSALGPRVQPAALTNVPLTESYRVRVRNCRGRLLPTISRADVAHFILEELENPRHIRQVVPLCY